MAHDPVQILDKPTLSYSLSTPGLFYVVRDCVLVKARQMHIRWTARIWRREGVESHWCCSPVPRDSFSIPSVSLFYWACQLSSSVIQISFYPIFFRIQVLAASGVFLAIFQLGVAPSVIKRIGMVAWQRAGCLLAVVIFVVVSSAKSLSWNKDSLFVVLFLSNALVIIGIGSVRVRVFSALRDGPRRAWCSFRGQLHQLVLFSFVGGAASPPLASQLFRQKLGSYSRRCKFW